MDILPRIGTFFVLIGLGLLILFGVSAMGKDINVIYLLLSMAAFFLGYIFRRRAQPRESGRFGSIRRAGDYSRKRREEKMNKNQKK